MCPIILRILPAKLVTYNPQNYTSTLGSGVVKIKEIETDSLEINYKLCHLITVTLVSYIYTKLTIIPKLCILLKENIQELF